MDILRNVFNELNNLVTRANTIKSETINVRLIRLINGYQLGVSFRQIECNFANIIIDARDENHIDLYSNVLEFFSRDSFGILAFEYQNRLFDVFNCILTSEMAFVTENKKLADLIEISNYHSLPTVNDKKAKSLLNIYKLIDKTKQENIQPL